MHPPAPYPLRPRQSDKVLGILGEAEDLASRRGSSVVETKDLVAARQSAAGPPPRPVLLASTALPNGNVAREAIGLAARDPTATEAANPYSPGSVPHPFWREAFREGRAANPPGPTWFEWEE